MQDKIITGEQALSIIQSYSVLKVVNEILPDNVQAIIENGYTEEVSKKMSKETFIVITISNELHKIGEAMIKNINEITGFKGTAFKLEVDKFPEIKLQSISEEEINKLEVNKQC